MAASEDRVEREGALLLAVGGLLLAVILPVHGPTEADLATQMTHIAGTGGRWAVVHWLAALALLMLAAGALLMVLANALRARATAPPGAWAIFALGALLTIVTAVTEATAISRIAHAGDPDEFVTWWSLASGFGNGFMLMALAAAVIAWAVAGADRPPMPAWLCWTGPVVALASALGWSLAQHLRLEAGGPVWFVSTVAMLAWLAALGFRMRTGAGPER